MATTTQTTLRLTSSHPSQTSDLNNLGERLVGTWEMSGEVSGTVTYEWMEGGFFLIQRVDLEQYGQRIKGLRSSATKSPSVQSRVRR